MKKLLLVSFFALAIPLSARAQEMSLDNFENVLGWRPISSDGVTMKIESALGHHGNSLGLKFDFHGGSGYAIAEKDFQLDLPENYEFSFYCRGNTPVNNFEFKMIDSLGNVFWIKQLDIRYPEEWTKKIIRKSDITFAWGPSGGGTIRRVSKIQFVVSAGTGGEGEIFIDDFKIRATVPDSTPLPPLEATASSSMEGYEPSLAVDHDESTSWISSGNSGNEWLLIDRKQSRDLGGVVVDWNSKDFAADYDVSLSDDGKEWTNAYEVRNGNGGRDYIYLPEAECRYIKLDFLKGNGEDRFSIREISIKGVEFGSSLNNFFAAIAKDSPTGYYPKYFMNEQSYWTVIGANGDSKKALMNEQGQVEVSKLGFSMEPFLYHDGSLLTWRDVSTGQSLARNFLPVPSVRWSHDAVGLDITAFAGGEAGHSILYIRYVFTNRGDGPYHGKLFLALRPFQVDPPWQSLNIVGGVTNISSMSMSGGVINVDSTRVIPLTTPQSFGAATFDSGDITEYISKGSVPVPRSVDDHFKHASGALEYSLDVAPGESRTICLAVPFHEDEADCHPGIQNAEKFLERKLDSTETYWSNRLKSVEVQLPGPGRDVINTIKTNLQYILINRDGPALQPATRSYDRSWIRDGSMMSEALLEFGFAKEVREFIDWYSKYIYNDGKVPCVVDSRGADAVPENDSHGEYIYAVMEYFDFTRDTTWLRGKFESIIRVMDYIQYLRATQMTDSIRKGGDDLRACYGLMPESISHEGYSNHPEHSYWDDFFTMLGLKDAAQIAAILGEHEYAEKFSRERDDFRECLYNSIRLAMANKNIDYIPGCVELGDFDATSTTVGIDPCGEMQNIPEPQLNNTFDRYYRFFMSRKTGKVSWDAYTPYETRIIGSMVHLGRRVEANELLEFFMSDRRPIAWNEWPEVIWKNRDEPKVIGDMPHTWVGSDFIRSVRAMLVYESDTSLVVGAGIPLNWISDTNKVVVKDLPTRYGKLSYTAFSNGGKLEFEVSGHLDPMPAHIIVEVPVNSPIKRVELNGSEVKSLSSASVDLPSLPAHLVITY